ncbi:MAG: YfhO family protein [Anaerolineae bacterium]|nr:YfhO family protein [Anaerolineae bacterium]
MIRNELCSSKMVWVGAGLLLLFCLYLWPATLGGQSLLPADVLFTDPIWQAQAPADFTRPSNALLVDQIYQFYPWRIFAQQELLHGRLPLWDPYIYSGTPFIANGQSAVFYPINLLLLGLPSYLIPGWSACLRLFIAALGMYSLLRVWKKSVTASLIAGMAFALGSFTIPLLGHPHTNVGVWLPWMILAADRTIFSSHPWRWVGVGSLVIGVQFLGGHAETSFFVLMVWGLYSLIALWKAHTSFKSRLAKFGMLALSFVLGTALAAVQLVPFLELLPQSNYFLYRSQEARTQPLIYTGFWRNSAMLITTLFPNLFGNPATDNWWIGTGFSNYTGVLYMGILPLFIAGLGAWRRRTDWRVAFFALLGLLWLGVLGRWPVIDWIRRLPLLNVTSFSLMVYCFSVAVLAGLGFDLLWRDEDSPQTARPLALSLFVFAGVGGLGFGSVYIVLRAFKSTFLRWGQRYVETQVYGHPPHPYPLEYYLAQLEDRYWQIMSVFDPACVTPYLPVLAALSGALILWAMWKKYLRPNWAKNLLAAVIVIDLWAFGSNFNPTLPAEQLLPQTPELNFLVERQGYDRIAIISKGLPPNTGMPFGLLDIRGYDIFVGRYDALLNTLDRDPDGLLLSEHNDQIFDLLGVRYLLSAEPLAEHERLKLVYDGEIHIYERTPLPRAYLTGAYQVIDDKQTLLEQLGNPKTPSRRLVLLETTPSIPSDDQVPPGNAQIVVYQANRVEVKTAAQSAQLLVLSDTLYPGWKAFVDGREMPIYRANYAFRAVAVPSGEHTVSFTYQPSLFYVGAWISLSSVGILVIVAGAAWWKSKARKKI